MESIGANFKLLPEHLLEGTEENISQNSRFLGIDLSPIFPEYEAGVWITGSNPDSNMKQGTFWPPERIYFDSWDVSFPVKVNSYLLLPDQGIEVYRCKETHHIVCAEDENALCSQVGRYSCVHEAEGHAQTYSKVQSGSSITTAGYLKDSAKNTLLQWLWNWNVRIRDLL